MTLTCAHAICVMVPFKDCGNQHFTPFNQQNTNMFFKTFLGAMLVGIGSFFAPMDQFFVIFWLVRENGGETYTKRGL